ncbi:hypothetical protein ACFFLM_12725, partial [Deinococcus oregonensis]
SSQAESVPYRGRFLIFSVRRSAALRHPAGGAVLGTAQITSSPIDAVAISLSSVLTSQSLTGTSYAIAIPTSTSDETIASRLPIAGSASGLTQPSEINMTGRTSFMRK